MLDMNVTGLTLRTTSITYTTTVGKVEACSHGNENNNRASADESSCMPVLTSVSVMIVPEADHVKTSI